MAEKIALLKDINPAASDVFGQAGLEVVRFPKSASINELAALAVDASALGVRSGPGIPNEVFRDSATLEAIGCFCAGTNHVDTQSAAEMGVAVFNSIDENARSVAEYVIGNVFGLLRRIPYHNKQMHDGTWTKTDEASHEVVGRTLGIVGCGSVGSIVSELAYGVGMNVVFYDINPNATAHKSAVRMDSLDELMQQADIVTLHVSSNEHTRGLINEQNLSLMKDGSYLINAARADVIDQDAVKEALDSGKLAGLAMDVHEGEPAKKGEPFNHLLQGHDRVIFTPHIGGSTKEAQSNIGRVVARRVLGYLTTGSTVGCVNLPEIGVGTVEHGTTRITNIHRNIPGVDAKLAAILAEHDLNVRSKDLSTKKNIGYVVFDVEGDINTETLLQFNTLPSAIRTRILT